MCSTGCSRVNGRTTTRRWSTRFAGPTPGQCLEALSIDRSVEPSPDFRGVTAEARRRLSRFLRADLEGYGEGRLDIVEEPTSHLSPYLHFGQISPVEVWRKVNDAACAGSDPRTPRYAFETALYLNNKYFLDGRDANSFVNVLWLFGLHDRAWAENPVFGKVRMMTRSGLDSKYNVTAYIDSVQN